MLKNIISRFGIYAMLSAFVFILISCDNSTSPIEENSALKKDIFGNWEIYKKCIEKNKIDGNDYGHFYDKVGRIDTSKWNISKIYTQDNLIAVYISGYGVFASAAWLNSSTSPDNHWIMCYDAVEPYNDKLVKIEIELNGINPLKGTFTERMYDSTNTVLKVLAKFEISGVKQ